jgi:Bacterial regulatory proteins, luxR family
MARLNKQIAADPGTGEKTVKVHRARVMAKMDARSVAELVQLARCVGNSIRPVLGDRGATLHWREDIQQSNAYSPRRWVGAGVQ